MALLECPDCREKVSDQAPACPHCGRPMRAATSRPETRSKDGDAECPRCHKLVTPVVTSVGGGSCSVGRREKWTCPSCKATMHRSGCFVATATYGDEDAIEVRFLRLFRDHVLATRWTGRMLIVLYYRLGPYLAWIVERAPVLRRLARWCLDRAVIQIESRTSLSRAAIRTAILRPRCANPNSSRAEGRAALPRKSEGEATRQ
jgi:hypothetical protein